MKNLKIYSVCLLVVIWTPARSIDRPDTQQLPLQIDANSIQHNDARAVTKFIGNVVLIRGDLTLKGDSLILNQTENGLSFGKVIGSPAVFKTRRKVEEGWVKGQASELDYDETEALLKRNLQRRLASRDLEVVSFDVAVDEVTAAQGHYGVAMAALILPESLKLSGGGNVGRVRSGLTRQATDAMATAARRVDTKAPAAPAMRPGGSRPSNDRPDFSL